MRTTSSGTIVLAALCVTTWLGTAWADDPQRPTAKPTSEETSEDIEHTLVVGIGGAGELELQGGAFHAGANVMVEWDAVENWLELELGASILSAEGGVEMPVDLLFK
jgi:hypothetical protein